MSSKNVRTTFEFEFPSEKIILLPFFPRSRETHCRIRVRICHPSRAAVVICLFQGCLTLWIIRTAARRRPRPKVRWRGDVPVAAAAREVMPANRYRSLILSYTRSASRPAAPAPSAADGFRAHVISSAVAAPADDFSPFPSPL